MHGALLIASFINREELKMTDMNKEAISVLNDLIETSKDGQAGFKTCAEDIKHPELKTLFINRATDCGTAAAELQSAVRAMGGDPETSTSVSGDLHRRWVDVKSMFTGKGEEAVLNEAERGEDHALKAYRDAMEKINKHNLVGIRDLVERQYHGVQRNHDQVKALRNQARARS
jgi:uncharacterized protein (TIGR02284 family)